MVNYEILLYPDKRLKKNCEPVAEINNSIRDLTSAMIGTMYRVSGIGLAAPQVGVLKRIFVMDCSEKESDPDPMIFINPKIIWTSEEKKVHEEGCLSIPEFLADIERPSEVCIESLDEYGNKREHLFDGLKATCAQHEIDHLNGVLFIDYLRPLRRQFVKAKMLKLQRERMRNDSKNK